MLLQASMIFSAFSYIHHGHPVTGCKVRGHPHFCRRAALWCASLDCDTDCEDLKFRLASMVIQNMAMCAAAACTLQQSTADSMTTEDSPDSVGVHAQLLHCSRWGMVDCIAPCSRIRADSFMVQNRCHTWCVSTSPATHANIGTATQLGRMWACSLKRCAALHCEATVALH